MCRKCVGKGALLACATPLGSPFTIGFFESGLPAETPLVFNFSYVSPEPVLVNNQLFLCLF